MTAKKKLDYAEQHAEGRSFFFDEGEDQNFGADYLAKFEAAMEDDCNTADAIAAVFEYVRAINSTITDTSSTALAELAEKRLVTMCDILGIILDKEEEALDAEIEQLVDYRKRQINRSEYDEKVAKAEARANNGFWGAAGASALNAENASSSTVIS